MKPYPAQGILSAIWRVAAYKWYFKTYPPKRTAIVYVLLLENAKQCIENDYKAIADMETVFLCDVHSTDRNRVLKYCVAHNRNKAPGGFIPPGVFCSRLKVRQQTDTLQKQKTLRLCLGQGGNMAYAAQFDTTQYKSAA